MVTGLAVSLQVGLDHGKKLSKQGQKPFIPIHHMEAHALTARMIQKVKSIALFFTDI